MEYICPDPDTKSDVLRVFFLNQSRTTIMLHSSLRSANLSHSLLLLVLQITLKMVLNDTSAA